MQKFIGAVVVYGLAGFGLFVILQRRHEERKKRGA